MLWVLRFVGGVLGRLSFWAGFRSRVTIENLARAFPEWPPGMVRKVALKSYASLGMVFFEFLYLRVAGKTAIERGLDITNLAEFLPDLFRPNGAILLSGHIGNWEWLALGCALRVKKPLDVIIKNQRSRRAERFLIRMRTRFGNHMLDAGNVRAIFRALRNGELLAILGDQAATPEDVRVPFFGRMVSTLEGTARLALATRSPIFFLEPYERTRHGYRCRFHRIPFDDLTQTTPETIHELTARHTAMLEQAIREQPALWLWQHKRWKHAEDESTAMNEGPTFTEDLKP